MLRVLVPFDGSAPALRAVSHAIAMKDTLRPPLEVLLINVQPGIPMLEMMRDGRPSVVHQLEEPLKAQGAQTLAPARLALEQASIENRSCVVIGEAAQLIVDYAKTYHCEMVVMGTHGLGAMARLLLGSVATKVLHLASIPVVLVP